MRPTAFGEGYVQTLAAWRKDFLDARPKIAELGFGQRFQRMWEYYLTYCQAGFEAGCIDVVHLQLRKSA